MTQQTQGRQLIALLKKRPMSTMALQAQWISTCPWKRIVEQLKPNERLTKAKIYPDNGRWFYVYRVVSSNKPCSNKDLNTDSRGVATSTKSEPCACR